MYSTIIKKRCKCGCNKWPTLSCFGYNYNCLPEDLKEKAGTKRKVQIKTRNKRVALTAKLHKVQNEVEGSDKWKSDLWFTARHHEMTGKCLLCGMPTTKGFTNKIFKNSIAHIFQKSYFKSIKWHELNWIELCFYGNSHHTNFDNAMLSFEDIKNKYPEAWSEIVTKFKILYPLMTSQEQGRVSQVLIDVYENN